MTRTAHVALYDTLADWEVGYLLVELRTGRFTGEPWQIVTVAASADPVTTMGGLRIVPDLVLADLDPAASDLLILPGADLWDDGRGDDFAAAADRFLEAGVPVAAICGATAGLARAGLLDQRRHTSAAAGVPRGHRIRGRRPLRRRARRGRRRPDHRRAAVAGPVRPGHAEPARTGVGPRRSRRTRPSSIAATPAATRC